MDYDKNSFLAGLSVGRTLKGWAGLGVCSGGASEATTNLQGYTMEELPLHYSDIVFGQINLTGE